MCIYITLSTGNRLRWIWLEKLNQTAFNLALNFHPPSLLKGSLFSVSVHPSQCLFIANFFRRQSCILCLNQEIRCFCGAVHVIPAELISSLHLAGPSASYEPGRGKTSLLAWWLGCIHVMWNAYSCRNVFVPSCILKTHGSKIKFCL